MNPDLLKGLIGVGSALLGVVLATFKDEIINLFVSSKKYKYLKGTWGCRWIENPSQQNPEGKTIFDNVEITKINGKMIEGKGYTNEVGYYYLKGKISKSSITLTYVVKQGSDKSGTVVLLLDEDVLDKLEGCWCQHRKGEIVVGQTKWQKNGK